jgi:predicted nucleic acid-binding protein
MNDNTTFVDSNIILYLFTDDTRKKEIILSMFTAGYTISTQVVGENVNVCLHSSMLLMVCVSIILIFCTLMSVSNYCNNNCTFA